MSSLADLPELIGFFSYSRDDDTDSFSALSALRTRIQGELRAQLGRTPKTFRLWQDKEAIPAGTLWETEIKVATTQCVFFIPIITPTVVASPYCRFELEAFLAREAELGRSDLVFPILYIDVPALEDPARRQNDMVLALLTKRQYVDWRKLRHRDVHTTDVSEAIEQFCRHIRDALNKPWLSPEQRAAQEKATALQRAEDERKRQEAEARRQEEEARRREEEERRRAAAAREREERRQREEEEEQRRADERRLRDAANAKRLAEEEQRLAEERRLRDEARAKRLAEEEQRLAEERRLRDEAKAKRLAEEEQRRAEERRLREEAKAKRLALDEQRRAEKEERRRQLGAQAHPWWPPSRLVLAAASIVGAVLLVGIGVWLVVSRTSAPATTASHPGAPPAPTAVAPAPAPVAAAPAPVTAAPAPAAPSQPAGDATLSAQQERKLKPGDTFQECTKCPMMIVVPAGNFMMGTPAAEARADDDEGPQHRVTIDQQFAVAQFAITFDEWDACAADDGCKRYKPYDHGWGRGLRPVINVSWDDAKEYVAWLSRKTGKAYRLLSEAEYEYSARAGTTTAYPWGSAIGMYNATCKACGSVWDNQKTAPVGMSAPNKFGLYDMVGNVSEWTEDCWHRSYDGAPADGSAWTSGNCDTRVERGGTWNADPRGVRSASRYGDAPDVRSWTTGFRVARTLLVP